MKTTLRHLYTWLAAASSLLLSTPEAQASQQKFDLEFRVLNATKHAIDFCYIAPSDCRAVAAGDTHTNALISDGEQVPFFYYWLYHTTIKICRKSTPLSRVITTPVSEKKDSDIVFYSMSITEEATRQLCSDTKQPAGKPLLNKEHRQ